MKKSVGLFDASRLALSSEGEEQNRAEGDASRVGRRDRLNPRHAGLSSQPSGA
jgi:hypothetical protein